MTRVDPVVDFVAFLTRPSYAEPNFMVVLYWMVAIASVAVAVAAARGLPGQTDAVRIARALVRFVIGSMWWQQALWKYPSNLGGLLYWTKQMVDHSAFPIQGAFVANVILPHFEPIGVVVFFVEIAIGISLMLGLLTRLSAFGGALFIGNLWLGLYRVNAEWPWSYAFLILLLAIFAVEGYGRSLGCDALLRGNERLRSRFPSILMRFT